MVNLTFSRIKRFSLCLALVCVTPLIVVAQTQANPANHVPAQVEVSTSRFHPGSDLVFKIRLNESLPEGTRFDVRLSPVALDQELSVSSSEPVNKERTEFILKTKIPEAALPGEWHIKVVWLFLAGTSWTSNTLATNADFRFTVEGPKVAIPSKANVEIVNDHR